MISTTSPVASTLPGTQLRYFQSRDEFDTPTRILQSARVSGSSIKRGQSQHNVESPLAVKSLSQLSNDVADVVDAADAADAADLANIFESSGKGSATRSENINVDDLAREQGLETLRHALLWKVGELRREVEDLDVQVSRAQVGVSRQERLSAFDRMPIEDLISGLLDSNDKALSGLDLVDPKQLLVPENTMPHMPVPGLDVESLKFFSGFNVQLVHSSMTYADAAVDGDDGYDDYESDNGISRHIRITQYTISICHEQSGISFLLQLNVNQTDLEVMSFHAQPSTILPLWARGVITDWSSCHNVSVFLYGVAEYGRLAKERAEAFCKIATEFPNLIHGAAYNIHDDDDSGSNNIDTNYYQWLGESRLVATGTDGLSVTFSWDVEHDSGTGDVNQKIEAHASAPAYYADIDEDCILARVPGIFKLLLRRSGGRCAIVLLIRNLFTDGV
ncbi:hypothetical protein V1514DRAFT_323529 [Lipomyces japonicus]|uniref:uncharacterized protein n=1 Tax=Lipomyces japonicus TaxID=56871 RepID=UPI0034CF725C